MRQGHAPAGGCLLSISTEYRVMVKGQSTIGFNETAVGIIAPRWFIDGLCHTIPVRQVELAITVGKLFKPEEALKVKCCYYYSKISENAWSVVKNRPYKFENTRSIKNIYLLAVPKPTIGYIKVN